MRDEDVGCETLHDNPHKACTQTSFNARCAESNDATNASDGVNYASGTMVWTLFDYMGEPPVGGFEVSSSYGQFDLVGFPKAAASWYRTQWLLNVADGPDKTYFTNGSYEVRLVESWESPNSWNQTRGNKTRAIHAYSNAPFIELQVNGHSQGSRPVVPMHQGPGSYAEWTAVPWEAGTLTAIAHDGTGRALATASRHTCGAPAGLKLGIDAPSPSTGTGSALLLDGHDAALVRCEVVDASGRVVHFASHNITFKVLSGPGEVLGTGNGDQHSHQPNNAPWHTAFHGLVRAVVRATSISARAIHERKLLAHIDHHGPMSSKNAAATSSDDSGHSATAADSTDDIVVEASTPGLSSVRITIKTSTDPETDGVLAAAKAAAGKPVYFFPDQK